MARPMTRRAFLGTGGKALGGVALLGVGACASGESAEVVGEATATGAAPTAQPTTTGSSEPVELRMAWWGSDERHQRTLDALDLYMERNPHVTVGPEYTGDFGQYFDRLSTQMAGGGAPDLIQMSGQFINEYASRGALMDLSPFVPDPIDLSEWDETLAEEGRIGGELVGLPPGVDAYAVLYNRTKLEELGLEFPGETWTWDDFAAIAREIGDAGGEGYFGSEDAGYQYEVLQVFLRQRGKDLFVDGEIGYDKADVMELWQFWADLREAGAIVTPDIQALSTEPQNSPLVQNHAAIEFTTSSQLTNFAALTPDELGITTYPFGPDGTPGQVVRAGMFFSANRDTELGEETARLIDFLLHDPEAAAILQTTRAVPAPMAMREVVRPQVDEAEQRSFDYLDLASEYATPLELFPPGFSDHRDLYERLYNEVAFGQLGIEEGVDQLMAEAPGLIG